MSLAECRVVVEVRRFNNLRGYAVEILMPNRPKMGLRRAQVVEIRFRGASALQT